MKQQVNYAERAEKIIRCAWDAAGGDANETATSLIQSLVYLAVRSAKPREQLAAFLALLHEMHDTMPAELAREGAGYQPGPMPGQSKRVIETVQAILRSYPSGAEPHLVMLVFASESAERDGVIEVDAHTKGSGDVSDVGEKSLKTFAERLHAALRSIADEIAAECGGVALDKDDYGRLARGGAA